MKSVGTMRNERKVRNDIRNHEVPSFPIRPGCLERESQRAPFRVDDAQHAESPASTVPRVLSRRIQDLLLP